MNDRTGVNPKAPFVVKADALLQPLIPDYLRHRRSDLDAIADGLARGDFAAVRKIGHNMHGSGGAYGLPPLSEIGRQIEDAALAKNIAGVRAAAEELRMFLDAVKLPP